MLSFIHLKDFVTVSVMPTRWRWGIPLTLLLLAVVAYANSFPAAFIQDDLHIVKNNPLVKSCDLYLIFTTDYWHGVENSGLYRPLTILSLALNRLLTGLEPWGFHLVNLLLHAGVTVLIWLTLPRWGVPLLAALLSAVFFAVHPIHTEVINEAVGRSELLVAIFVLLALFFARSDGRWTKTLVCISFALALLAKEHGIVLLGLLPLFDAYHDRTLLVWRRRWPLYLGMVVITALWMVLRLYGVDHAGPRSIYSMTAVPLAYLPWDQRVLTALQYQWVYLGKLLVPLELHAVYSLPDLPPILVSLWSPRALLVVLATLLAAGLTIYGWRRRAWWALPVAAYVVTFTPTANIVMPIGVTMAERLAYLPSLWFCVLLGWGGDDALRRWSSWRKPLLAIVIGYALFLTGSTGMRNRDFVSEPVLWQREVVVNEADYLGWQSYAESLNGSRRYAEAEQAYLRVMQMQPEFQGVRRSYFAFLFERGRYQEGIALEEQTLSMARNQGDLSGAAYDLVNLATAHLELKDFQRALAYLEEPEMAYFEQQDISDGFRGRAFQGLGEHARAVETFARIKSYDMDRNIPLYYAISLLNLGRMEEAEKRARQAIGLNERPEAWNLLGTILAQKHSYGEAVKAFERAVQLAPEQQHYRQNLEQARLLLQSAGSAVP